MFGRRRFERELANVRQQAEILLVEVGQLRGRQAQLEADVVYWRTRCERLIDAGLARRQEITSPVMEAVTPARPDGLAGLFSGLGVSEVETRTPSTPPGQAAS